MAVSRRHRKRLGLWFLAIILGALYLYFLTVLHFQATHVIRTNENALMSDFKEQREYKKAKSVSNTDTKTLELDRGASIYRLTKNNGTKTDSKALKPDRTTTFHSSTQKNGTKADSKALKPDRKMTFHSSNQNNGNNGPRQKLRVKLDHSKEQKSTLWELSDFLPPWMKDYLEWHKGKRATLTQEIWQQWNKNKNINLRDATGTKFLVIQCLQSNSDESCGTLLERLGLLPFYLKMAYETNRMLLIHWTVPADLSEYLAPPLGGCDWRAPAWMKQLLLDDREGVLIRNETQVLNDTSYFHNFDSEFLLRVQLKHSFEFEKNYDALRNTLDKNNIEEASFREVIHDVWAIFFVPTATIRKNIHKTLDSNPGMEIGRYTSIEFTSLNTPEEDGGAAENISVAKRVIRYIWKLLINEPIMVVTNATDVAKALVMEHNNTAMEGEKRVFARYQTLSRWALDHGKVDPRELLPQQLLDFGDANVTTDTPEIYRDIFVNLYVMALGRCVVSFEDEDRSTFGRLASLIGYDSNCYCQLFPGTRKRWGAKDTLSILGDSSFLNYVFKPRIRYRGLPPKFEFRIPMIKDGADEMNTVFKQMKQVKIQSGGDQGDSEGALPEWMEEYLSWHRDTKSQLTPSNWNSTKYAILACFDTHKKCGGISDRLKPLPMVVWEAYLSKRILLIWWERPKPLEEWLVPPKHADGGVDWTVPPFLKEEILKAYPNTKKNNGLRFLNSWNRHEVFRKGNMKQTVVVYNVQSPEAGEDHYIEEQILYATQSSGLNSVLGNTTLATPHSSNAVTSYQDVFHHLFRRFFTPSPRLANLIESKMKEHNLVPGEYAAVHLRALYGERDHRDPKEAIELATLGVNCASNLFPGAPVFFASDMSFAVDAAHAYGKLHGLPIVSLDFDPNGNNPIHLDKDPDWMNRSASAYDSTFVDLYMLAESRCVAYTNGGYGLFGSLLSHEPECKTRFFQGRKKLMKCMWMNDNFERQELKLPKVDDIVTGERVG